MMVTWSSHGGHMVEPHMVVTWSSHGGHMVIICALHVLMSARQ